MEIILRQPYSFHQIGKRANQEDARFPDCDRPQGVKPAFVVCDGVGGQDKGEIASKTVSEAIGNYISTVDLTKNFCASEFSLTLEAAYSGLTKAIRNGGREMATTMTFACFHKGGIFCAHIGDSRIYHIRPGVGILYQSQDHSLVNALVHSGNITPEEYIDHPQSNVITRCMGYVANDSNRPPASTFQIEDVEEGDYIFLCTDGVLHCITDSQLVEILSSDSNDREKIATLAKLCEESSDNNTGYLIGVESVIHEIEDTLEKPSYMSISGQTQPIEIFNNEIIEVRAQATQSLGKRLSDFFNKLF